MILRLYLDLYKSLLFSLMDGFDLVWIAVHLFIHFRPFRIDVFSSVPFFLIKPSLVSQCVILRGIRAPLLELARFLARLENTSNFTITPKTGRLIDLNKPNDITII